ncbi:related to ATP-binding protein, putative pantothenate kinase [Rhynchosporium agropyri]|uniref:Related to ATP-binding protein, putative pantothenate kinase n=1 Tax=Rhynchosporium agropyri TaxID=914238 RepID=A0A1E1K1Y3_9HELO|nr:related to ATP-binding protein, putative pantothenate kinase [Rhynchosporium agropyri]
MATIIDDKSTHCIPFILSLLSSQSTSSTSSPFIIGLNGVQGAGKTTLVETLSSTLNTHGHKTLVLSIDDLYLTHADQVSLAETHKQNPLVQHRGEPGTHDIELAATVFDALKEGREVRVPSYDKSLFNGAGDRVPVSEWRTVNRPGEEKIRVVIFEGWCVGFRALGSSGVRAKIEAEGTRTLHSHRVQDLLFVDEKLEGYEVMNRTFDALIHIDAEETEFVYEWRQQQEEVMRRERGMGMSREQVVRFVDGYCPAYELYTEALREGVFKGIEGMDGRQLRLIVGKDRRVKEVVKI